MNTDGLRVVQLTMSNFSTMRKYDTPAVEGSMTNGQHTLTFVPWVADCGAQGETVYCSCGWSSNAEAPGAHCKHEHHSKRFVNHGLDATHSGMYLAAMVWFGRQLRAAKEAADAAEQARREMLSDAEEAAGWQGMSERA